MIESLRIQNYKSIVDATVELGRINVFIGENGSGKTNVLEALGMVAAKVSERTTDEDLYLRGMRPAPASLTGSAFAHARSNEITIELRVVDDAESTPKAPFELGIRAARQKDVIAGQTLDWALRSPMSKRFFETHPGVVAHIHRAPQPSPDQPGSIWPEFKTEREMLDRLLGAYCIYSLNALVLRGLHVESRRSPLGLHGEGLDVLIASFTDAERKRLEDFGRLMNWFAEIEIDQTGTHRRAGYKRGRSLSEMYFRDRFLADGEIFSAENANDGVLFVLFYAALFLSDKTPSVFAIDNIETALNPQLCRHLIRALAQLATEHRKQALVTTHNPAVLDGLNLHDDAQRLFVVERSDEGHTRIRRVRMKPGRPEEKMKLSEMWMRGLLGGIPTHF